MSAFPGFFDRDCGMDNPTSLSPTSIDKKVLVTESDLKLTRSSKKRCFEAVDGSSSIRADGCWPTPTPLPTKPRIKRERLFPHEAPQQCCTCHDNRMQPSTPRQPHHNNSTRQQPQQKSSYRWPYTHTGEYQHEPPTLRRLPELSNPSSVEYATAVTEHQWRRSFAQERAQQAHSKMAAMRAQRVVPAALPAYEERPRIPRVIRSAVKRKIGIYTPEARLERIRRFHEKRKQRVFHKRVKYDCRKRLANACPRIKGRFVKKEELLATSDASEATQSTDEKGESGSSPLVVVVVAACE